VTQRGRNFTAAGVAARQARVAQRVAAGVKTCSKCGESKSLTDFTPNRRSGDGRDGWCRPCRAASRRQPRTEKTCPDCERTLPLPAFNSDRSRFDGRACYCRDCAATRLRELTARRNGTEPGLPLDVRRQWAAERTKKACSLCERTLPLEEFTARRGAPDGRDSWCKECARAQQRERQQQRVADLATMTAAQRQAHETALAWRRPATGHAERECCYGNGNGQHARGCPIGRVAVG
jgi:hypothetical protein